MSLDGGSDWYPRVSLGLSTAVDGDFVLSTVVTSSQAVANTVAGLPLVDGRLDWAAQLLAATLGVG